MDFFTIITAFVVAIVFFTIYIGLDALLRKRRQSEGLKQRILGESTYDMSSGDEALISMEQSRSNTAEAMAVMLKMIGTNVDQAAAAIRKDFLIAGLSPINGPIYYLFFKRIGSIFFILLSIPFFLTDKTGSPALQQYFLGGLIVFFALMGPKLYLSNSIQKRKKILSRSFPDSLDLLLVCVESGLALDASLAKVCAELGAAHPEITKELNKTRLELALLNDRSQALFNLADRTDLISFRSLVAALIQTEKFGTSLTDTLRVLSDDYRQTRLMEAENKANRLPALITIPLILMLMPAFMMIILGPAVVSIKAQGGFFGASGQ